MQPSVIIEPCNYSATTYTQAVEMLLEHGADPNLPLGRAVGSALCALTSHTALKKRDYGATLTLVGSCAFSLRAIDILIA